MANLTCFNDLIVREIRESNKFQELEEIIVNNPQFNEEGKYFYVEEILKTFFKEEILIFLDLDIKKLIDTNFNDIHWHLVTREIMSLIRYNKTKKSKIRILKEVKDKNHRIIRHGQYNVEFLNDPKKGTYQILSIYNDHNDHFWVGIAVDMGITTDFALFPDLFTRVLNKLTKGHDPDQSLLQVGDFKISYKVRDLTDGRIKIYSINDGLNSTWIDVIDKCLDLDCDDLDRYEFGKVLSYLSMMSTKKV